MPMYEYRCDDCDTTFIRTLTISEHEKETKRPECPDCGSAKTHQLFSTFFAKTASKT